MARKRTPQPTDRELEILGILWNHGPSTVRQVNEEMNKQRRTGYTTTLKLMQIMTEKGLVVRDDSNFQHVYKPAVSEEQTQGQLIGDLLERAFLSKKELSLIMGVFSKVEKILEDLNLYES